MGEHVLSLHTLKVNDMISPMGLDDRSVAFSWQLSGTERGIGQAAWRVMVASDPNLLARNEPDVWDSGRREGRPLRAAYEGPHLQGFTRYWWKVAVWDERGQAADSAASCFDTGLFGEDWQASWIWKPHDAAIAPQTNDFAYFRKEIKLGKTAALAKLYVSAHHYVQLHINGTRIGGYGTPAPTDPRRTKYYAAYDVTELLQEGANSIAAVVHYLGGHGQNYVDGFPGFILQGEINYEDGTSETIMTDKSWDVLLEIPHRIGTPYQQNRRISAIEDYDARVLDAAWMLPLGGSDAVLSGKAVVASRIEAEQWPLHWQTIPEGRIDEIIVPAAVAVQEAGCQVFDTGKIVSGWPRLTAAGVAGITVRLRYSEDLDDNGRVKHNVANETSEHYYDQYTMAGRSEETWEPDLSYKAFRYVEVTGYPGLLTAEQVRIVSANTPMDNAGGFTSSSELLNDLYAACIQTQKNNALGQLVDCPHREQAQYLADSDLHAETLQYNFGESRHMLEKVLHDFADGQLDDGRFPFVFPANFKHPDFNIRIPEWDLHFVTLLWKTYAMSGDVRLMERYYVNARRMILYYLSRSDVVLGLVAKNKDFVDWAMESRMKYGLDWHISDHPYPNIDQEGDFLTVQNVKVYHALQLLCKMADTLGFKADADLMLQRAGLLGTSIQTHLYDAKQKRYRDCYGSEQSHQGTNVLAYQYGLVPEEDRASVLSAIAADGLHTKTLLSLNLLRVLFENGEEAQAYRLLSKEDYPGWGYMIRQGSRTIWEGFDDVESHSHAWTAYPARMLVEYVVGIQAASPGWEHIRIKPFIPDDLEWAEGVAVTPPGSVRVRWEKKPDGLLLEADIPVNTSAAVILPLGSELLESESTIWRHYAENHGERPTSLIGTSGIMSCDRGTDGLTIRITSGAYRFMLRTS